MANQYCRQCKRIPLLYEDEFYFGHCDYCREPIEERNRQEDDWDRYHPGAPCPETELTPLPFPPQSEES